MVHWLLILALAFVAIALLLLVVLVIRRAVLARRDRRYAEAERRVRPLAIALVEGQTVEQPTLSSGDQAVLADVLGRYSRKLTGDADARIAAYFGGKPALHTALSDLRRRRIADGVVRVPAVGRAGQGASGGRGTGAWMTLHQRGACRASPSCRGYLRQLRTG